MLRSHPLHLHYSPADDPLHNFYIPALLARAHYDRSAGFFSSSAWQLGRPRTTVSAKRFTRSQTSHVAWAQPLSVVIAYHLV